MPTRRRRRVLTMIDDPGNPLGPAWKPATAADRRQLLELQRPRPGDIILHPDRDLVAFLVGLARKRGVSVLFRTAGESSPPPPR